MEPTRAPQSGSRFTTFLIFGLVFLIAAVAMLAVGGSFWGWMVLGVLVFVAGIVLVVHLARRNRGAA